ncbi:dihydropteroate synthase [Streptomyces spiralis]|uniref:dihydropteroate synthase n=1 Tax=Streptomyces spiralis TaxID=66376 RepID=UPI0036749C41
MNVTPDSFSDGGRSFAPDAAVAPAVALLEQGADIVDVGGEPTLPARRARRWRRSFGGSCRSSAGWPPRAQSSADTMRAEVAAQALDAGDRLIVDPGLGFAKTPRHSWALLARLR